MDKYHHLVQSIVQYYSTCLVIDSSTCDDTQLDLLVKTLTAQKFLNEADHNKICKAVNKKSCLLSTLHSKPIICFAFLDTLHAGEPSTLQQLQVEIYKKVAEINNEIIISRIECLHLSSVTSYTTVTTNISTTAAATTAVAAITIDTVDTIAIATVTASVTTTTTTTAPITTTAALTTITTAPTTTTTAATATNTPNTTTTVTTITAPITTTTNATVNVVTNATTAQIKHIEPDTSPEPCKSQDVISDVLCDYQQNLKGVYRNLPEISTQGWFDDSVQKQFINVTLVKSLEKNEQNMEDYYSSTGKMIKGEVVYDPHPYINYDEIFQVCSTYQLFLLEGNAGTGKTSLAYKVCKKWAQGEVLQQYSCIILVELRNLKSGDEITLKTLLSALGQSVSNELCSEIHRKQGNGILIWLEGWDEVDDSFITDSAFDNLLYGKMLHQANIVITTRPSATRTLKKFSFTHKFKLIGFIQKQVEKYVTRYCAGIHPKLNLAEKFMDHLNATRGLVYLAEVPFFLAILVKLFKADKKLPRKLTDTYSSFLMICLQNHKEKIHGDTEPIRSFDNLPSEMQGIFHCMEKCAYEQLLLHSQLTEQEISQEFFNCSKVPNNFDGLGLFNVTSVANVQVTGVTKYYDFQFKPIQEMLAALHLTRLASTDLTKELSETFGNKELEMVWVIYAGLTGLKQVTIKNVLEKHKIMLSQQPLISLPAKSLKSLVKAWKQCHTYYMEMAGKLNKEFLLTLILCCYEANNSKACREIADYLYSDKVCRFEIPPNHATPYLLLAVSYFISHSGKTWSLRCNTVIQSSVQLLFKHINDCEHNLISPEATGHLWVFCCVVRSSDIDAYCSAIRSQSSLQWIHLLPGSHLGDDGTCKLCECFSFDSQVIKIEIDGCGIGSKGLRQIGRMLNVNRKILCVDVRRNNFTLDDVKEFLQHIKNQQYLESLLLDKEYCENPEICTILREINLNRTKNDSIPLAITHR